MNLTWTTELDKDSCKEGSEYELDLNLNLNLGFNL
jgi:hypothetical protein